MRSSVGSNSGDAKFNRIDNGGENFNRGNATIGDLDSRFDQTLKSVHGLLKGQSLPGKVLLARRSDNIRNTRQQEQSPPLRKSLPERGIGPSKNADKSSEEMHHINKTMTDTSLDKQSVPTTSSDSTSEQVHKTSICARSTNSARVMKFTKELSASTMRLDTLRELAWSGVPPHMRPNVWRLILGYAPSNSDRRQGVLKRKRLEYLDCVSLYYDIPDSERSNEDNNMLRQITVDCPRTIPDISFFQQEGVQKSLERILYTWGIRHPASGYVQGINDIVTPFLVVFLSEYFEGSLDNWMISNLSTETITAVEADCYWCLSKLLDGMQDHYTFAQPGIQRLVFKLKELVRRLDEPISRHMDEEGLEFLQFAFRWFNCLLVREMPFHLVIRLWDTYLAEGDALPDFLVYIFASFLLTWSNELKKLDFQEMVIFLQHLPTQNWTHTELEMVLSRAYMWHAMFNNAPRHLAT